MNSISSNDTSKPEGGAVLAALNGSTPEMDINQKQLEAAMQWVKRFGHTETGHYGKVLADELLRLRKVNQEQVSKITKLEMTVERLNEVILFGDEE